MNAMKKFIVLKFGGTSVSTYKRWQNINKIVQERLQAGFYPIVVCSALSGVSNILESLLPKAIHQYAEVQDIIKDLRLKHQTLATQMGVWNKKLIEDLEENFKEIESLLLGISLVKDIGPKIHARVMAQGELLSSKIGCSFLKSQKLAASWWDVRTILMSEEDNHPNPWRQYLSAQCATQPDPSLQEKMQQETAQVIVTQGFLASNAQGETLLLGRGGSDTSASYLAAKILAHRCEIWTDVPGMYTANPRQIPGARLLKKLYSIEAQEIASTGAKVLHPRCLAPVQQANIPLHIYSTDHPHLEGTVITPEISGKGTQNKGQVKAISVRKAITLISVESLKMWHEVGFLANLFTCFKKHGFSIDLLSTSETNVTVSLDPVANALNPQSLLKLQKDLEQFGHVQTIHPCSVISLVGQNIRSILHKLGPVFKVFEEKKIFMMSQAASDLNLTFVLEEREADAICQQLHLILFDHIVPDEIFGATYSETFAEIKDIKSHSDQKEEKNSLTWWRKEDSRKKILSLVKKTSPLYIYHRPTLQQHIDQLKSIKAVDQIFYAMKANHHPEILKTVIENGLGLESVSIGELDWIQKNFPSLPPHRILFTPNFALKEEYQWAFHQGHHVTIDNLFPLAEWPTLFHQKKIILRLDPGQGRGHHDHVYTGGEQSKFGISQDEIKTAKELIEKVQCQVIGLHAHAGSGITLGSHWQEVALTLAQASEHFPNVEFLNIGGGLGIPPRPGDLPLNLEEIETSLQQFKKAYPQFKLWLEPGRFIVAKAGILVGKVTQLKRKGNTFYVGMDTGMNSLIRPALYGAYHDIVNLTHLNEVPTLTAHVVGPICESGDTLGYGRRLPTTQEGDVILIDQAGAYGRVMSSHYNLRSPAEEIFLPE